MGFNILLVARYLQHFGNGLGLAIHIRTHVLESHSRISRVAVKIGNDALEVLVDGYR